MERKCTIVKAARGGTTILTENEEKEAQKAITLDRSDETLRVQEQKWSHGHQEQFGIGGFKGGNSYHPVLGYGDFSGRAQKATGEVSQKKYDSGEVKRSKLTQIARNRPQKEPPCEKLSGKNRK